MRATTLATAVIVANRLAEATGPMSEEELFRGLDWRGRMTRPELLGVLVERGAVKLEDGKYTALDREYLRKAEVSPDGMAVNLPLRNADTRFTTWASDLIPQAGLREKLRSIISDMRGEYKWKMLVCAELQKVLRDVFHSAFTLREIEEAMEGLSEELGLVAAENLTGGDVSRNYHDGSVSLEEALSADYGPYAWKLVPDNSGIPAYRVLSETERRHKKTTLEREKEESEREERDNVIRKIADGLPAFLEGKKELTTREVVVGLIEMEPDADGRLNALAAAALKAVGWVAVKRRHSHDRPGKRTVFVPKDSLSQDGDGPAPSSSAASDGPAGEGTAKAVDMSDVDEMIEELLRPVEYRDPDPGVADDEPAVERVPGIHVERAPEPQEQPMTEREQEPSRDPDPPDDHPSGRLPKDWKELVNAYIGGIPERTFVSMDEVLLRGIHVMPHDVDFRQKGHVSRHLVNMGLEPGSYKDRKYVFAPRSRPDDEQLESHFSEIDRLIVDAIGISATNHPEWMEESDVVNLSYLEHAALTLWEGVPRPRSALFPGHRDEEWQRRVLAKMIEDGLVNPVGEGFFKTYVGVEGADDILDREYLIPTFWPGRDSRQEEPGQEEPEEAPKSEAEPEEQEPPPPKGAPESLEGLVKEMYAVLQDHAETIRKLKARVKELEIRTGVRDGKGDRVADRRS